jgi:hypothetical protein
MERLDGRDHEYESVVPKHSQEIAVLRIGYVFFIGCPEIIKLSQF